MKKPMELCEQIDASFKEIIEYTKSPETFKGRVRTVIAEMSEERKAEMAERHKRGQKMKFQRPLAKVYNHSDETTYFLYSDNIARVFHGCAGDFTIYHKDGNVYKLSDQESRLFSDNLKSQGYGLQSPDPDGDHGTFYQVAKEG